METGEQLGGGRANGFTPLPVPDLRQEASGRKLLRIIQEELSGLRAAQLAQGLGNLLPQLCLNRVRTALLRAAGLRIAEGSLIMGDVFLSGSGDWSALFSVGKKTFITGPLRINFGASVHIGDSVNIGHDCMLLTVDHEIGEPWKRAGISTHAPIVIEDGVWLASRVTVLPGVTVGKGSVVAAGAVVAANVPPHTLVAGIPARVLRSLNGAR